MEGRRDGIVASVNVNALARENVVEVLEGEAGVMTPEKGLALQQLALDAFGVAARGEGLAMAVFLLADGACGSTGGAPRMLRVALLDEGTGRGRGRRGGC